MWRIVQSQRTEKLFDAFFQRLMRPCEEAADPMTPEVVVVQDMGMARWLTHRLAERQGIAANIQFLVPAALADLAYSAWLEEAPSVWDFRGAAPNNRAVISEKLAPNGQNTCGRPGGLPSAIEGQDEPVKGTAADGPVGISKRPAPAGAAIAAEEDPWGRLGLTWRLFRLLSTHSQDPQLQKLHRYIGNDPTGEKRYQLAAQIAAAFDRYMVYRQDVLLSWEDGKHADGQSVEEPVSSLSGKLSWETGKDSDWQAHLWRLLAKENPASHKARKHALFMKAISNRCGPRVPQKLPSRVHLFGITMMAPVHLEVFNALAFHIEVILYFLNPSREYWGDVFMAAWQGAGSEPQPIWHDGELFPSKERINPLVASWALSGCFLLNRMLDVVACHQDCFEDFEPRTLLEWVQYDILTLSDRRTEEPEKRSLCLNTASIQVHACHSPMREIQVLHDQLAYFLETLPDLTPEHVVVMAPDIGLYAPYVEAVFGTRDDPRLPWNLSDRKSVEEDPVLQSILDLLRLPQWRCTASEIFSLLEVPAIAARFGFTDEGLERVRTWVREAGIRWGLDETMRAEMQLPGNAEHTWGRGLERLFAGYALPPQEIFCEQVLSYPDVEVSDAPWLGALSTLLEAVAKWRRRLQEPKTLEEWRLHGNILVDDFFHPDAEESLGCFRRALDTLATAARNAECSQPISVHVVRDQLEEILARSPNVRRFLSGGITFCNLVPMRAIPFRVVCLLGMNDADFPRAEHLPPFDLTAQSPRPEDRRRRLEDRYLFLEALLSARDVFYVSYIGRDIRDNSLKVPSVVVSELLDYIEQSYNVENGSIMDAIVLEHPLQPFSRRLFDGSHAQLFSYDALWLRAVQVAEQPKVPPFVDQALKLEAPKMAEVALDDLIRFFEDPCAWFLEKRLGMILSKKEDALEDEEPFGLNDLERYRLADEILAGLLQKEDPQQIQRRVRGRGWLPHGVAGDLLFEETLQSTQAMAEKVADERGMSRRVVEVDIPVGAVRLRGWLRDVTERGRLVYRPAQIKAKDRLRLWIRHLALCAVRPSCVDLKSVHIGRGKEKEDVFRLTSVDAPEKHLADLVQLWREGHQRPLPFFPESSWIYALKSCKTARRSPPAEICGKTWKDDFSRKGEAFRPSVRTAFRGLDPLNDTFVHLADRVFGPILKMLPDS
ncbi:exodeoxyribonuclease V subunit gamma [Desulfosoma sp.]|uniref:exodeoxyribonuclease V subunit gamma n=1 Tax=Desulfosoma sp. TaxID=2603217 RepID=UPI00404B23F9